MKQQKYIILRYLENQGNGVTGKNLIISNTVLDDHKSEL